MLSLPYGYCMSQNSGLSMSCKNETSSLGYGTYYSNALPANTLITDINKMHTVNT
jgi:hypothetical protein